MYLHIQYLLDATDKNDQGIRYGRKIYGKLPVITAVFERLGQLPFLFPGTRFHVVFVLAASFQNTLTFAYAPGSNTSRMVPVSTDTMNP